LKKTVLLNVWMERARQHQPNTFSVLFLDVNNMGCCH